jgi:diadenosine tetraphosphate (Ap4A) HIT family hydrolase
MKDRIALITSLRARLISSLRAVPPIAASGCFFCRQADPSANRIAESNRTCFVRFDNFPATPGHVEVVPKRHVVSFFELTEDEVVDVYRLLKTMRRRLAEEHRPDGFTIGVNEGRAAGRSIDHLHIHLIPRHFGDVQDPRGGIRQVVPNCDPSIWSAASR